MVTCLTTEAGPQPQTLSAVLSLSTGGRGGGAAVLSLSTGGRSGGAAVLSLSTGGRGRRLASRCIISLGASLAHFLTAV